jgi:hypothetical protein
MTSRNYLLLIKIINIFIINNIYFSELLWMYDEIFNDGKMKNSNQVKEAEYFIIGFYMSLFSYCLKLFRQ